MKCQELESPLLAVMDGRATAEERRQVETHVAACPSCVRRLEEMQAAWSVLDSLPTMEPALGFNARLRARLAEQPSQSGWFFWFPVRLRVVAALAILAAVALWVSLRPTLYPTTPAQAEVQSQQDFAVVKNLPVLENYDVVSSFDALAALPGAQSTSDSSQPTD